MKASQVIAADSARSGEPLWLYTNSFTIETSLCEVCLSFGQGFHQAGGRNIHSRLVTTPVHLRRLAKAVNGAVSQYEDAFGHIPEADDTRKPL
jgi:hypothetical protein